LNAFLQVVELADHTLRSVVVRLVAAHSRTCAARNQEFMLLRDKLSFL
jgi:hypothetical protein